LKNFTIQFLQRIWGDVQQGENIDLYITVFLAILLVLLNLLGIVPDTLLTPLTLAVLGLLALAMVGNRYQFEDLVRRVTQNSTTLFQAEVAATFESDLQNATEIWLTGVSLNRTVKSHYGLLEKLLRQGVQIRVLLVDPGCDESIAMVTQREYRDRVSEDRIRSTIHDTLEDLCSLREIAPDHLNLRVIRFPISFGAIATDPHTSMGTLYLEHYSYKMAGGSVPKFTLATEDRQWYDFLSIGPISCQREARTL